MTNQVYATKVKMSQTFVSGKRVPLTELKLKTHTVIGLKTIDKHGYSAYVLGIGTASKASKPISGMLKSISSENIPAKIVEIRMDNPSIKPGEVLDLSSILTPGTTIQASSAVKGMGFTGVVKRWGFHGGPRTHGQSDRLRAPGSIGRGTTPGRVLPGKKMAGRHGNFVKTIRNLKVVSFEKETGILKISGSVPGAKNTSVKITITKPAPIEGN